MTATPPVGGMVTMAELQEIRPRLTGKVGLCHGCFDLLHVGHARHLAAAKSMVDWLVVTVTADEFVRKGVGRPVFSAFCRAELVAALRSVDFVAVSPWATATPVLQSVRPDAFVKGSEYEFEGRLHPGFAEEKAVAERMCIETLFTHELTYSSSDVLNTGRATPIDWRSSETASATDG